MAMLARACVMLFAGTTSVVLGACQAVPPSRTYTQDQLFQPTTVWKAELTFTAEQWKAIEPLRGTPTGRPVRVADDWLQGPEGHRNGWAVARGIDFEYVHGDLTFDGVPYRDVAVRYKGNGSFGPRAVSAFKTSFKVDLNKYTKGQKIAGVSTLNFHNNLADVSWMNEPIAYRLYRDAGVAAPRTSYVQLTVTVKGMFEKRYAGLYSLVENVDTNFLTAHLGASAGALLKPVTMKPFNDLGATWGKYNQTYDPKEDLSDGQKRRIIEFCKFATHSTDAEFATRIGNYIDLDQFTRYMAVLVWMNNWDSLLWNGQNYYVFMPDKSGKLMFIPWDQDFSFGNHSYQTDGKMALGDIYKPWPESVPFLERMMKVAAFKTAYLTRLQEYQGTIFRPTRFAPLVAEIARAIRPAVLIDGPKPAGGNRQAMTASEQTESFDRIVAGAGKIGVVAFTAERWASVTEQLANPK